MRQTPRILNVFSAVILAALVSACTVEPPPSSPPELTFAQVTPLRLPVKSVDIIMPDVRDIVPADASLEWPESPASAVEKLLRHQLVADGMGEDTLTVHVERADVMRRDLPKDTSFTGMFTQGPETAYDLSVKVSFEMNNSNPPRIVTGKVVGDRRVTIVEGMSPAERDRAFFNATEKLMNEIAGSVDAVMRRNVLAAPETWQ